MPVLKDLRFEEDLQLEVYQYWDYRTLLSDYFEKCKIFDKRYSLRHFTKRLELNSPGYIQAILKGERQLSERLMQQLAQLLGFQHEARQYFELLVKLDRLELSNPLYKEYMQTIQRLRQKRLKVKSLDDAQCDCISSWLHLAIREMMLMEGASLNVQWIKKCLSHLIATSPRQVMNCISDLLSAQLLEEHEEGIRLQDPVLKLEDERVNKLMKLYHKETLEQAIVGLDHKSQDREYGAVMVATTPDKIQQLKAKLRRERREALELLNTAPGEATVVMSFSYQLFPVAKLPETQK